MNSSLAYAVQVETGRGYEASEPGEVAIRCASRALEGMQKEAVLYRSGRDLGLRLLCDEGPYLNGTDLAPPPLAYFSAGVAACFAGEVLRVLTGRGLSTDGFRLVLDCFFSMEGSALQGTMKACNVPVLPVPVALNVWGEEPEGGTMATDSVAGALLPQVFTAVTLI